MSHQLEYSLNGYYIKSDTKILLGLLLFIINVIIAIYIILSPLYIINEYMTKNIENDFIKLFMSLLSYILGFIGIIVLSILTIPYSIILLFSSLISYKNQIF
jgi:hypothetical protein